MQFKFILEHGLTKIRFQRLAGLKLGIHLSFEKAHCAPTCLLRTIQRDVCVLKNFLGSIPVFWYRDTDTYADMDLLSFDLKRRLYCFDEITAESTCFNWLIYAHLDDRKLVTAKPRDSFVLPHTVI